MISVFVIASIAAVRAGLCALLGAEDDLRVVGQATTLTDRTVQDADADLVLINVDTERRGGLEALRSVADEGKAIILLVDDLYDVASLGGFLRQGCGLLHIDAEETELSAAIRAVYQGFVVLDPRFAIAVAWGYQRRSPDPGPPGRETLTPREKEVLQVLSQGLGNKQIAHRLGISEHTAKFHVSSIYAKLGATNRAEAVTLGIRLGLVAL